MEEEQVIQLLQTNVQLLGRGTHRFQELLETMVELLGKQQQWFRMEREQQRSTRLGAIALHGGRCTVFHEAPKVDEDGAADLEQWERSDECLVDWERWESEQDAQRSAWARSWSVWYGGVEEQWAVWKDGCERAEQLTTAVQSGQDVAVHDMRRLTSSLEAHALRGRVLSSKLTQRLFRLRESLVRREAEEHAAQAWSTYLRQRSERCVVQWNRWDELEEAAEFASPPVTKTKTKTRSQSTKLVPSDEAAAVVSLPDSSTVGTKRSGSSRGSEASSRRRWTCAFCQLRNESGHRLCDQCGLSLEQASALVTSSTVAESPQDLMSSAVRQTMTEFVEVSTLGFAATSSLDRLEATLSGVMAKARTTLTEVHGLWRRLQDRQVRLYHLTALRRAHFEASMDAIQRLQRRVKGMYARERLRRAVMAYMKHADARPERLRLAVYRELIESERRYVSDLRALFELREGLLRKVEAGEVTLTERDVQDIFLDTPAILMLNEALLADLEYQWARWPAAPVRFGTVMVRYLHYLKEYSTYVGGYETALDAIRRWSLQDRAFHAWLTGPASSPVTLESYMIRPVQRVPRYILLLREMLERQHPEHADYAQLQAALQGLKEVASGINEKKGHLEDLQRVHYIQSHLDPTSDSSYLIAPHRSFVLGREAVLYLNVDSDVDSSVESSVDVLVVVFSDLLLLLRPSAKKSAQKLRPDQMPWASARGSLTWRTCRMVPLILIAGVEEKSSLVTTSSSSAALSSSPPKGGSMLPFTVMGHGLHVQYRQSTNTAADRSLFVAFAEDADRSAVLVALQRERQRLLDQRRSIRSNKIDREPQAAILREGFLVKQGYFVRSLRRRWFVLTRDGALRYSVRKSDATPRSSIDLSLYAVRLAHRQDLPFAFELYQPAALTARAYLLAASTDWERRSWILDLEKFSLPVASDPAASVPLAPSQTMLMEELEEDELPDSDAALDSSPPSEYAALRPALSEPLLHLSAPHHAQHLSSSLGSLHRNSH